MSPHVHSAMEIYIRAVFIASLFHSFLPPWDADAFKPFPTFVKFYKVLIYVIGYVAINARSTVYPSISTQTVGGVNESIATEKERRCLMLASMLIFNPISAMIGFVVLCVCLAIIIILARWVLSLTGLVIPQPLLIVLGLILFLVLLMFFLDWTGIYVFSLR